jgi:hypothetical protein
MIRFVICQAVFLEAKFRTFPPIATHRFDGLRTVDKQELSTLPHF